MSEVTSLKATCIFMDNFVYESLLSLLLGFSCIVILYKEWARFARSLLLHLHETVDQLIKNNQYLVTDMINIITIAKFFTLQIISYLWWFLHIIYSPKLF